MPGDVTAPMTVQYASRRAEIWLGYRRVWRQRLWKSQLAIFLVFAGATYLLTAYPAPPSLSTLALPALIGAVPVLLLILYPQFRFKPQSRTVTIGMSGITTVVGRKSGRISWKNIRSIVEDRGYVVVQGSSGNAFIIPPRAFETPAAKAEFVQAMRARAAAR